MSTHTMFQTQRDLIVRMTEALPGELLFAVPEGRKNNIAWNLGHIVTVQQQLVYSLSGLPIGVPEHYPALFGKDTSPENWPEPPEMAEIFSLLRSTADGFEADRAAGKFTQFQPYTMSLTGITVSTLEEAADFNVFHEGIHFGIIFTLMRELGAR